ncbi:MAG: heavy metal-binding domain-containing protein [Sulfurovum sp.]|nr:heavy metal-binding domain-containing protein [Sulfurovum sp.]
MIDIIIVLTLLLLGFIFGSIAEKNHYKSIRRRENLFKHIPTIGLKNPINPDNIRTTRLVVGNVVISVDYFKRFMAFISNIFGGNVSSYETLIDRARREAILRLKEDAKGASEIINLKLEASSINKSAKGSIGSIEMFAYATAIYRKK